MAQRQTFTQAELTRILKAARAANCNVQIEPGRVRIVSEAAEKQDDEVVDEIARHFRAKR